jgi:RNA polymerase sigma-70 factor (ECF subfamily)
MVSEAGIELARPAAIPRRWGTTAGAHGADAALRGDHSFRSPVTSIGPNGGGGEIDDGSEDRVLVDRLRAADECAFTTLVERLGASLRRLARLYTTDAVADEVVQETWIAVLDGIHKFEGRSSLRTWITRILLNIARTRGQREGRQIPFSAFADPSAESEASVEPDRFQGIGDRFPGGWVSFPERWDEQPERRYLSTEGVEVARGAIASLPTAQREVVTLRDVEGWSSEDVSEALGITPGNQRVLLHRGRSKVRAALEAAIADALVLEGSLR